MVFAVIFKTHVTLCVEETMPPKPSRTTNSHVPPGTACVASKTVQMSPGGKDKEEAPNQGFQNEKLAQSCSRWKGIAKARRKRIIAQQLCRRAMKLKMEALERELKICKDELEKKTPKLVFYDLYQKERECEPALHQNITQGGWHGPGGSRVYFDDEDAVVEDAAADTNSKSEEQLVSGEESVASDEDSKSLWKRICGEEAGSSDEEAPTPEQNFKRLREVRLALPAPPLSDDGGVPAVSPTAPSPLKPRFMQDDLDNVAARVVAEAAAAGAEGH